MKTESYLTFLMHRCCGMLDGMRQDWVYALFVTCVPSVGYAWIAKPTNDPVPFLIICLISGCSTLLAFGWLHSQRIIQQTVVTRIRQLLHQQTGSVIGEGKSGKCCDKRMQQFSVDEDRLQRICLRCGHHEVYGITGFSGESSMDFQTEMGWRVA